MYSFLHRIIECIKLLPSYLLLDIGAERLIQVGKWVENAESCVSRRRVSCAFHARFMRCSASSVI